MRQDDPKPEQDFCDNCNNVPGSTGWICESCHRCIGGLDPCGHEPLCPTRRGEWR